MAAKETQGESEFELPRAVVQRLVREALPDGVGVSKDAKVAFGVAARIFVSYCTATANEIALEGNRKTLSSQDVLTALEDMEFGEFREPLQKNLEGFKKEQSRKKERKATAAAEKRAADEAAATQAAAMYAAPVAAFAAPAGEAGMETMAAVAMDGGAAAMETSAPAPVAVQVVPVAVVAAAVVAPVAAVAVAVAPVVAVAAAAPEQAAAAMES